jgi:hypothetical protein
MNIFITAQQIPEFECSYYVGDEIFQSVARFNERAAKEGGKEYHEVTGPVTN